MDKITTILAMLIATAALASRAVDVGEFSIDELASYTLLDAKLERPLAMLSVHKYFDTRGLGDAAARQPAHPRQGYFVAVRDPTMTDELEVLWGRGPVSMHLRETPTEVASLWWDERHDLLWVMFIMSVSHQSVAEIHAVPMVKDGERGPISVADEQPSLRSTKVLSHPRGEIDRIVEVTIGPEGDNKVVLEFYRRDEDAESVRIEVDKGRMSVLRGIELEEIDQVIRSRGD